MAPDRIPSGTPSLPTMPALNAAAARSCALPVMPASASGGAETRACAPLEATRKQTTPASPAAPLPSLAKPTATPMANSKPRLEKIAPPAAAIIGAAAPMSGMSPWPRRSSSPATGRTAMGSISARPSGCSDARLTRIMTRLPSGDWPLAR